MKFAPLASLAAIALIALTGCEPATMALMQRAGAANMSANLMNETPDGLHAVLCGAGSPLPVARTGAIQIAARMKRHLTPHAYPPRAASTMRPTARSMAVLGSGTTETLSIAAPHAPDETPVNVRAVVSEIAVKSNVIEVQPILTNDLPVISNV